MDITEIGGKQCATRGRGRPRKDTDQDTEHKNARMETEEVTQKQRADDEGQETVTTMVNCVAQTTWWNSANVRDTGTRTSKAEQAA